MISSFPSRLMIALLFVLQLLPLQTNGKVWYQHVQDMHSVFGSGFGRSEKYSDIDEMFKGITNLMDRREENLSEQLKQIAPKFSEGNYGHRIYFHWGFNGRPEDSTALSERIKAATDDMQVREALFDKIRSVQRQRNQKTMLYVQICCLNPNDRSKALNGREMNAIAALAYDTHILGDYIEGTEKTIKALMPMDKLMEDICKVFRRLEHEDKDFRDNPERKHLQKDFERKMNQAAKASTQMEAAKEMLRISKAFVPRLLRMTGRVRNALQLKDMEVGSEQGGSAN